MSHPITVCEAALGAVTAGNGTRVSEVKPACWLLSSGNGSGIRARVWLEDDWLLVDSPAPGGSRAEDAWVLLERNRLLPGIARYVLPPGHGTPRLRAELPVDGSVDSTMWLREVWHAIAHQSVGQPGVGEPVRLAEPGSEGSHGTSAEDLLRLCGELGWSTRRQRDGRLTVDLASRRESGQAAITTDGACVRFASVLGRADGCTTASREAISLLLLLVSGLVRLVRAVALDEGSGGGAGLAVVLPAPVSVEALGHARAAISVACDLCGPEVRLLQDDSTAAQFLRLWAGSGPVFGSWGEL